MISVGDFVFDTIEKANVQVLEKIEAWGYTSYKVFNPATGRVYKANEEQLSSSGSTMQYDENYLRYLTDNEFSVLQKTESYEDEYTDMWKTFFHSISIEQRKNYVCQRNLFPIWKRKHAVEFR